MNAVTAMSSTLDTMRASEAPSTQSDVAMGHAVHIRNVTHRYGQFTAIDHVSLSIAAGEIVALLGPSGCGKSTLLRVIAGFAQQSEGSIEIAEKPIDHLPANARNIGIVFQNYALFPHMTVAQNVAYGLNARGVSRRAIRDSVTELLELVQLSALSERMPAELSGGQQQRVALARALAVKPTLLLLDEPFSALDKNLRLDMQLELKRLQRQLGLTIVLVTHDQDEAMGVADRIAVMNKGRVEQFDSPQAIYDRPDTQFVSGFIGTSNQLTGTVVEQDASRLAVKLSFGSLIELPTRTRFDIGETVVICVRPEQLRLGDRPWEGSWQVRRGLSLPMGPNEIHDLATSDGGTLKLIDSRAESASPTDPVAWCGIKPGMQPSVFSAPSASTTQ